MFWPNGTTHGTKRFNASPASPPVVAVADLPGYKYGYHTGDKWDRSFGVTELLTTDYWTLRMRSAQLFKRSHYARGMIRRLLTNEINTGLHLEADPLEEVLGMEPDALAEWTESVENRFSIWGKSPRACDAQELRTFGQIQRVARLESLVSGDVLVVLTQWQPTRLPRVQLINGANVQTPFPEPKLPKGHRIVHGVQIDAHGRHVAFFVRQEDNTIKRLPAYGEKSGRKLAWLVYGCEMRHGEVRGEPILGILLQSLHDLERYRDATLRKAVINSILAMFVTRDEDSAPSRGLGAAAAAVVKGSVATTDDSGNKRTLNVGEYVPGLVVDFLAPGEDIKPGTQGGTDQAFGEFEGAMIRAMSWALECPPEIMELAFSNNYSASQAAILEIRMYLDRVRMDFGENFCQPVYENWLISELLQGRIAAPGLLESWRDPGKFDIYGAWMFADWTGHVKPSTDPYKLVRAIEGATAMGLQTYDRAAREYSGTKFSRNIRKIKRERELLEEAGIAPASGAMAASPGAPPPGSGGDAGENADDNDEESED